MLRNYLIIAWRNLWNYKLFSIIYIFVISIIISVDCVSQQVNNWHQFRGTNSLGIAPESATSPLELDPEKNLAWKIPLASGLSSPCIIENRIFITGLLLLKAGYCFAML